MNWIAPIVTAATGYEDKRQESNDACVNRSATRMNEDVVVVLRSVQQAVCRTSRKFSYQLNRALLVINYGDPCVFLTTKIESSQLICAANITANEFHRMLLCVDTCIDCREQTFCPMQWHACFTSNRIRRKNRPAFLRFLWFSRNIVASASPIVTFLAHSIPFLVFSRSLLFKVLFSKAIFSFESIRILEFDDRNERYTK